MPELPEVESVRRSLGALVGLRVLRAHLRRRSVLVVPGDPPGGWERTLGPVRRGTRQPSTPRRATRAMLLEGAVVCDVARRGKRLAIVTGATDARTGDGHPGPSWCLDAHLGMTGQFLFLGPRQRLPAGLAPHCHATWTLSDGRRLVFCDPRRFGGLRAFPSLAALQHGAWGPLGPDALEVTGTELASRAGPSRRAVKAALLDQSVVAGVGNIYADEACFDAGVLPTRPCASMDEGAWERLSAAVRAVLAAAIDAGGSTVRDFARPDGTAGGYQAGHRVYGRGGRACLACGKELQTGVVGQRTTVWCRTCQR